jgi:hypothetical protein
MFSDIQRASAAVSFKENFMAKRAFPEMHWLLVCLIAAGLFATGTVSAANDPFVGRWKLDPAKSKITDRMQVEAAGANKFGFKFNGAGDPELIVLDGTDQPGMFGTTLAVSAEAPDTWKVVRKMNGKTLLTGIWKLSADGQVLNDSMSASQPDGSTMKMEATYRRAAAGSGFVGIWESTSDEMKMSGAFEMRIEPFESDGLSFVYPAQKRTRHMKFDGKDYMDEGPNVVPGSAGSGRRVNERTIEVTDKIHGNDIDKEQVTVSADNKTMTITVNPVGATKPNTLVFERIPEAAGSK